MLKTRIIPCLDVADGRLVVGRVPLAKVLGDPASAHLVRWSSFA
jgi:imidazole glycerol phosphate synthase subunit HisF